MLPARGLGLAGNAASAGSDSVHHSVGVGTGLRPLITAIEKPVVLACEDFQHATSVFDLSKLRARWRVGLGRRDHLDL
jgi:hypothetical protein